MQAELDAEPFEDSDDGAVLGSNVPGSWDTAAAWDASPVITGWG